MLHRRWRCEHTTAKYRCFCGGVPGSSPTISRDCEASAAEIESDRSAVVLPESRYGGASDTHLAHSSYRALPLPRVVPVSCCEHEEEVSQHPTHNRERCGFQRPDYRVALRCQTVLDGHTRHHPRTLPHPRACSRTHHHTNHANNPSPATPNSAALTVHIPSPSAAPSVRPAAPRAYSKNKENLAQFSSHAAHSKPSASTNANATTDDARRLRYALSPRVEKNAGNDPMSPWAVSSKLCPGSDDGFGETIAEWTQGSERRETSGPQVSQSSQSSRGHAAWKGDGVSSRC